MGNNNFDYQSLQDGRQNNFQEQKFYVWLGIDCKLKGLGLANQIVLSKSHLDSNILIWLQSDSKSYFDMVVQLGLESRFVLYFTQYLTWSSKNWLYNIKYWLNHQINWITVRFYKNDSYAMLFSQFWLI